MTCGASAKIRGENEIKVTTPTYFSDPPERYFMTSRTRYDGIAVSLQNKIKRKKKQKHKINENENSYYCSIR